AGRRDGALGPDGCGPAPDRGDRGLDGGVLVDPLLVGGILGEVLQVLGRQGADLVRMLGDPLPPLRTLLVVLLELLLLLLLGLAGLPVGDGEKDESEHDHEESLTFHSWRARSRRALVGLSLDHARLESAPAK